MEYEMYVGPKDVSVSRQTYLAALVHVHHECLISRNQVGKPSINSKPPLNFIGKSQKLTSLMHCCIYPHRKLSKWIKDTYQEKLWLITAQ